MSCRSFVLCLTFLTACNVDPTTDTPADIDVPTKGIERGPWVPPPDGRGEPVLIEEWTNLVNDAFAELKETNELLRGRLEVLEAAAPTMIEEDLHIGVHGLSLDAGFDDIHDALTWLAGQRIHPAATVTVHIPPGLWTYDEPLEINHPNGDRLHIVGDVDAPLDHTLRFVDSDGVIVRQGNTLAGLNGITLNGSEGTHIGVLADTGAVVDMSGTTWLTGWRGDAGIVARRGAVVTANGALSCDNDVGFLVELGGVLQVDDTRADRNELAGYVSTSGGVLTGADLDAHDSVNGYGISVESAGVASLTGTPTATGNIHGFHVKGGHLTAWDAQSTGNSGSGFFIAQGGSFQGPRAEAISNGQDGFAISGASFAALAMAMADSNQDVGFRIERHSTADVAMASAHSTTRAHQLALRIANASLADTRQFADVDDAGTRVAPSPGDASWIVE